MRKQSIINIGATFSTVLLTMTTLCACSNDENSQTFANGREITFTAKNLESTTRAELTEQLSNEFGLMAYRHSHDEWTGGDEMPNFMYRVKATKAQNAATWTTTKQYYWPYTSERIRFFAYAPYSVIDDYMSAVTQAGAPQIKEYHVADDALNQQDLMFAYTTDKLCSVGGTVSLTFYHIMSAIRFAIPPGEEGTINSVRLTDIPSTGTYTAMGSWGSVHTPATYTGVLGTTFILMPQTLPATAKLIVNYKKDANSSAKDLTFSLAGKVWESGRIYTYTINIVNSELQPEISTWEVADDESLAVDY